MAITLAGPYKAQMENGLNFRHSRSGNKLQLSRLQKVIGSLRTLQNRGIDTVSRLHLQSYIGEDPLNFSVQMRGWHSNFIRLAVATGMLTRTKQGQYSRYGLGPNSRDVIV